MRLVRVQFPAPRPKNKPYFDIKANAMNNQKLADELTKGKYAVFATDTIYGIHTSALNKDAVNKLYEIRGRAPDKPFIILVDSIEQIKNMGIPINTKTENILKKYWPGMLSVVLKCNKPEYEYLHRGTNTLAFRLPDKPNLRKLLSLSGPLISTSVNPEGLSPANNIYEARKYFGDKIDYYFDEGEIKSPPSTLISINKDKITILREGSVKI